MKVRCIDTRDTSPGLICKRYLTVGKEYEVEEVRTTDYLVMDDRGVTSSWLKSRFEIVAPPKVPKLVKGVDVGTVDTGSGRRFTKGKIYEVLSETAHSDLGPRYDLYSLRNDIGDIQEVFQRRFEIVRPDEVAVVPKSEYPKQVEAIEPSCRYWTLGKVYTAVRENECRGACYIIIDEQGNETSHSKARFKDVVEAKQELAVKKDFDVDAFNKVLQASNNISVEARKDIEKAVKAGKGEKLTFTVGTVIRPSGSNCACAVIKVDGYSGSKDKLTLVVVGQYDGTPHVSDGMVYTTDVFDSPQHLTDRFHKATVLAPSIRAFFGKV